MHTMRVSGFRGRSLEEAYHTVWSDNPAYPQRSMRWKSPNAMLTV